jgi:hypothetical protein
MDCPFDSNVTAFFSGSKFLTDTAKGLVEASPWATHTDDLEEGL